MKMNLLKGGLIVGSLLPIVVFAQAGGITGVAPIEGSQVNLQTILNNVSNWALGLLVALATLFIIYAAYLYLTAGGAEDQLDKAKNVLIYAAIAIGVGLLSKAVAYIVTQLIRGA